MKRLLMSSPFAVAAFWIGVYLLITLLPLLVLLFYAPPEGRGFWTEFSVGLGFIGLAMMALQWQPSLLYLCCSRHDGCGRSCPI